MLGHCQFCVQYMTASPDSSFEHACSAVLYAGGAGAALVLGRCHCRGQLGPAPSSRLVFVCCFHRRDSEKGLRLLAACIAAPLACFALLPRVQACSLSCPLPRIARESHLRSSPAVILRFPAPTGGGRPASHPAHGQDHAGTAAGMRGSSSVFLSVRYRIVLKLFLRLRSLCFLSRAALPFRCMPSFS
jgi:hypothetical protein